MSHLHAADAQLFVYFAWKTYENRPLLSNDELRQAAFLAVTRRTRNHLCRVLAVGGTACQMGMVLRFPASLPITCLLRMAQEAAQDGLEVFQGTMGDAAPDLHCYWGTGYTAHTLSAAEAADARAYLRRRLAD